MHGFRPALPLVLATFLVCRPALACDLKLGELFQGPVSPDFEGELQNLSRLLESCRASLERRRADESQRLARQTVQDWMGVYVRYFDAPPRELGAIPDWRLLMVSVTGPLRRLQRMTATMDWEGAHTQIRNLQAILGEFLQMLPKEVGGLGPVAHTIRTLAAIPGVDASEVEEHAARTRLLRRRFDAWRSDDGVLARLRALPEVALLDEALVRLERAHGQNDRDGILQASTALFSCLAPLETALAASIWSPPPAPSPTPPDTGP